MVEKKVRYIKSIRNFEGVNIPTFKNKDLDKLFVKQYYSTLHTLAGLNACSRDLINYLITVMDNDNVVRNDSYLRMKFVNAIKESTRQLDGVELTYADSNVRNAFAALTKRDCLIKLSKGVYKVNPEFYFRKDEVRRIEAIKLCLEFKSGVRDANMKLVYNVDTTEIVEEEDEIEEELKETSNPGEGINTNINFNTEDYE
jgi:hypothetical protein